MMRTIRRVKGDLAMRWRIRRIVWQSDIASMLSGRYSGSSQGKPRIKVISVSGRNVVKIR